MGRFNRAQPCFENRLEAGPAQLGNMSAGRGSEARPGKQAMCGPGINFTKDFPSHHQIEDILACFWSQVNFKTAISAKVARDTEIVLPLHVQKLVA